MSLKVPGRIIKISGNNITLDLDGEITETKINKKIGLKEGDYVLLEGEAIIDKVEKISSEEILKRL